MLRARDSHPLAFLHVLAFPTITTMLISGLWHGAGYTFILWGLLHGVYIVVNHLWRQYGPRPAEEPGPTAQLAGFALTFLAVVVAMVLFRAPDLDAAGNILGGMVGLHGLGLPGARFGASAMHLLDGGVTGARLRHRRRHPAGAPRDRAAPAELGADPRGLRAGALRPEAPVGDAGGAAPGAAPPAALAPDPAPGWCSSPPSPRCR